MTDQAPASAAGRAEEPPTITADDIADALRRPRPTPQQREVIESPLGTAIVIAGAGSGKTETMANRVLWLLANGHVTAGQILGLTFTRKAAGELAARIRERIGQLASEGLLEGIDEFDPPVVATYNSFANMIFRDNALLIGRESESVVLGEASAWQLVRSLVVRSSDERLMRLDRSVDSITKAVLSLSHALSENVADPGEVRSMAERFAALAELPPGGRGEYADVVGLASSIGSLPLLLDLAEEFATLKARRGFVEYSDQVALALQIVRRAPRVRDEFRERFRVVLLDEYQDTSVVQTWLLAELFREHAVMAVGDPHQSIYGWRGASAGNLDQFPAQFAGAARRYSLSTSWRNGRHILEVANKLVEPLAPSTRVGVAKLVAADHSSANRVDVVYEETLPAEADAAALWLKERLRHDHGAGTPPTAAMLFRTRKTQGAFIEALRRHDVPFHVLGVAGLTAEPEIADLVCALTVVNDPSAGSELVRLLAGSRWRLGVKDLHTLGRVASWLRDRDHAHQPLADEVKERLRASVAEGEGGSLVDALDFVAHAPAGHGILGDFSEPGLERLREAGLLFARLRSRAGLGLLDFVAFVEQELLLDIEVAANESRVLGSANMEAFYDALNDYLAVSDGGGLGGFLSWLRDAEWRDGLAPRPEDAEPGTVQLLTIHGSKGLEWDHVVVPRVVDGELPGRPNEGYGGWLSFGSLPYEFRGDADELPKFDWEGAQTRKELGQARDEFKDAVRARHELEERRLAYVAVTRARHSLLISGSFWASQTTPRPPSPFLAPLAESAIIPRLPALSEHEHNPLGDDVNLMTWPLDPLAGRRQRVEWAAALVRSSGPKHAGPWEADIDLLLEERKRALAAGDRVAVPSRVPASRFKDFVTDPAAVATALRRPMPEKPYRASTLGTLFHSWVEERYGLGGSGEVIDAFAGELDDDGSSAELEDLARLRDTFERSPYAGLRPVDVERELHLPFDGQIVICKIDAVYRIDGRYRIVDWKTGRAPRDAHELEERQLQLALYRLAYCRWKDIHPEEVDAEFYYVADDRIIAPERLHDEDELVALWRGATAPRAAAPVGP